MDKSSRAADGNVLNEVARTILAHLELDPGIVQSIRGHTGGQERSATLVVTVVLPRDEVDSVLAAVRRYEKDLEATRHLA